MMIFFKLKEKKKNALFQKVKFIITLFDFLNSVGLVMNL